MKNQNVAAAVMLLAALLAAGASGGHAQDRGATAPFQITETTIDDIALLAVLTAMIQSPTEIPRLFGIPAINWGTTKCPLTRQ